jgi:hypothetical protein
VLAGKLESDDAAIERIARERFGMIREGEILYRFVPVDSGNRALPLYLHQGRWQLGVTCWFG